MCYAYCTPTVRLEVWKIDQMSSKLDVGLKQRLNMLNLTRHPTNNPKQRTDSHGMPNKTSAFLFVGVFDWCVMSSNINQSVHAVLSS